MVLSVAMVKGLAFQGAVTEYVYTTRWLTGLNFFQAEKIRCTRSTRFFVLIIKSLHYLNYLKITGMPLAQANPCSKEQVFLLCFPSPCAWLPGKGGTVLPPARPAAAAAAEPSHPRPNQSAPSAPTRRAPAPAPHTKILPEMSVKKAKGELVSSLFQDGLCLAGVWGGGVSAEHIWFSGSFSRGALQWAFLINTFGHWGWKCTQPRALRAPDSALLCFCLPVYMCFYLLLLIWRKCCFNPEHLAAFLAFYFQRVSLL